VLCAILLDQLSKSWAHGLSELIIFGPFKFEYHLNSGVLFGNFHELPLHAKQVAQTTIGSFVLVSYFISLLLIPIKSRAILLGLSLLVGGIMANVYDRFQHLYVVDFISINITNFPYLNLADLFQFTGYALILFGLYHHSIYYWPKNDVRAKYLINPKFQIRFALLVSVICFFSAIISLIFSYSFFKENQSGIPFHLFMLFGLILSMTIALAAFVCAIYLSHRMAGPIYAIQRHIKHSLSGEEHKFQLRELDEFKEIEVDLNTLNQEMLKLKKVTNI
jgi:signal peptidase II